MGSILIGLSPLLSVIAGAPAAQAAPGTTASGSQFPDATGAGVQAHGGGATKAGDHYWSGEERGEDNKFRYVSVYRSNIAKHSNKCLDIQGGSTTAGAKLVRSECNGAAGQAWKIGTTTRPTDPTDPTDPPGTAKPDSPSNCNAGSPGTVGKNGATLASAPVGNYSATLTLTLL
ncbi:RICIN domain-containing protein [Streptomyces sp. SP18CS02]|uniref:RICIN domain-containing protein n=1 Tax=Streptomyces sp. SP18CS02 TaxID=3002531 RepID=UPI002E79763E|nr:RICIN domain-containing protein [Streptomyces sp. SP18CS02]MEE1754448.1 RICIN domain-containing protein [Streptomyces sp. SP18CS02]